MKQIITTIMAMFAAGVLFATAGCSGSGSSSPASVQKMNGYYAVTLDYANTTHKEMGRQLALSIRSVMPEYEQTLDGLLNLQMQILSTIIDGLTFDMIIARANALLPNLPREYQDEIAGMQETFNYNVDSLGDGKLSRNELLVFQLFPDVIRAYSCSASAAFGNGSVTGKTIIGRNLDWFSATLKAGAALHAVTTFKNGDKSVCNISLLGHLAAVSMFNTHKVFGAVLDSDTGAAYPDVQPGSSYRSYIFDLRYALENNATLTGVSNYMSDHTKKYTYNHLIFLVDENSAGVVENDVNDNLGSGRGLRVYDSALNENLEPGQTWVDMNDNPITGALAVVNDFRLKGNQYNQKQKFNTTRWTSFRIFYSLINSSVRFDSDLMKAVTGYPGPRFDGNMDYGAIFLSVPAPAPALGHYSGFYGENSPPYGTMHSVVMKMDTMELWVHFTPQTDAPPRLPTYQQIGNPLY